MASEVVDAMRQTGEDIIFKIDFDKSYDYMD